jgi:hypothetical protein
MIIQAGLAFVESLVDFANGGGTMSVEIVIGMNEMIAGIVQRGHGGANFRMFAIEGHRGRIGRGKSIDRRATREA